MVRDAQAQIHRFLEVLEDDRRNVDEFRHQHPDAAWVLVACIVSLVLGVLLSVVL